MTDNTDWSKVSSFFNGVIEEAKPPETQHDYGTHLEVHVYSPAFDETMKVEVPRYRVEEFMKRLGLWKAEVYSGKPVKEKTDDRNLQY